MAERTVPVKQDSGTSVTPTRQEENHLLPPVDIFEKEDRLVGLADLPGVSKEGIEVRVDNNILTIQAKPEEGYQATPLYEEYELLPFFRQFELNEEIDQDKIQADLKNGVLRLELPKAEKAKPKSIEVKVE